MPSILLFGATGLMGSHLVGALKKTHPTYPLTVYIRSTTHSLHSYLLNTIGVDEIITGDFSESAKISKLAERHDVVINCGSSWDVGLTKAIIEGLVKRFEEGKGKGRLIHISGTGNFVDGRTDGKLSEESKVWSVSFPCTAMSGVDLS
jgi:nucleoside-diphosphate-sugar epimerase